MLAESYRVLQLPFGAPMPQVRRAYRQLALQYHPDRNHGPEAQELFIKIQAAYEYLQRHHNAPYATTSAQAPAAPAKTQEELDWEKYQFVYEPPAHPKEYAAWARVAVERARRQAERDQAEYVARTLAFQQKWWYGLARAGSYMVLLCGVGVGVSIVLIPVLFWWTGYTRFVLMGVLISPIGLRVLTMMQDFRQEIRKHFGEDLKQVAK